MVGVGATNAQPNHRGSIMGTEQKVAVISGASQGIGAGLVKAFRDRNYRVVANSRSIKPASDEDILTAAGDIADPATAKRVIAEGLERFGRIDTLVNNAGIFIAKRFTNYTEVEFAAVVSTKPGRLLPHHAAGDRGDGAARQRAHGQHHHQPGEPR
jgi:NAD(P)-dependent dehydrogenase (short-subunit alcohol dehydrogenase family)